MATGDKKRAVMTDDIDNAQSSYPVMSLRAVDAAPDAAHTNNLISSAAVAAKASSLAAGMAIIATGNTHAAITKGQFVYIQNHATLPEGMYEATANIAANGTLSTSNVAAKNEGAANALKAAISEFGRLITSNTASYTADADGYINLSSYKPVDNCVPLYFYPIPYIWMIGNTSSSAGFKPGVWLYNYDGTKAANVTVSCKIVWLQIP